MGFVAVGRCVASGFWAVLKHRRRADWSREDHPGRCTHERAFGEDDVEAVSAFAAYAGVALAIMHLGQAQSRLAEDLQQAMQSRAVIEQAKGMLMGARGRTAEEAFTILIHLSQDTNRKLREVAQVIVDAGVGRA